MASRERTQVLVLRVWFEPDPAGEPLRARIITDVKRDNGNAGASVAKGTVEEVVGVVRAWIETFVSEHRKDLGG